MDFKVVLSQVFILFIVLLIGFYARRKKILNSEANKGLTELLINITFPFTIVSSFIQDYPKSVMFNAGKVFLLSFCIHSFSVFIGKIISMKFKNTTKKVLWFITIFSNCGFMGIPVMESIYGKIGIFYSSIYIIPFNIFVWTVGQIIFTGTEDKKVFKKALINPGIFAVLIGGIIFFTNPNLPVILVEVTNMMGSLTTPLSMIIIGSMLASTDIKDIFSDFSVFYGSAVRLFLIPLICLVTLKAIGIEGTVLGVCVISTAMPAAANTVIFSEKFGSNSLLASKIVFMSTAVSIITIPLYLLFI